MTTDVCYLVSNGFAARMILQSGVVTTLRDRGYTVALVAPAGTAQALADLGERHRIHIAEAPALHPERTRRYELWRRYVTEDVRHNPALWEKHVRARQGAGSARKRALADFRMLVNRVALGSRTMGRMLARRVDRVLDDDASRLLLQRLAPGCVVATYPSATMEAILLRAATRLGIRTVGHLLSWDNITTKGRFPVAPEHFISWGPIMTAELGEHYGANASRVAECGVAHFDAHAAASGGGTESALSALGLDPGRPYLFIGLGMPYHSPHELRIAEWLAEMVRGDRFGTSMQLVVRPHPQCLAGPYRVPDEWMRRLQALRGRRVAVDEPRVAPGPLRWAMEEDDLPHLVGLTRGSAVCLNSGSTLALEALLHDRPVVLTLFDGGESLPWWESAARVADFPHLAKLLRLGAMRVAGSFDELHAHVAGYLAEPDRDREARALARRLECGPCDGRASERIAAALAGFVEGTEPACAPAHGAALSLVEERVG